jgi:hypothetical protein
VCLQIGGNWERSPIGNMSFVSIGNVISADITCLKNIQCHNVCY